MREKNTSFNIYLRPGKKAILSSSWKCYHCNCFYFPIKLLKFCNIYICMSAYINTQKFEHIPVKNTSKISLQI